MYYHVWFGTRDRKWLLQGDVLTAVIELLWEISRSQGIRLLECEPMVEHMHVLLDVDPSELPTAVKLLKGTSSRRLFQRFSELKLDANTNHLWQKRYGAKEVETAALERVRAYIRTQEDRPEKFDRAPRVPGRP